MGGERAGYGKQIVVTLAQQLQAKYGSCFDYPNVTRMIKFATRFPDVQIIVPLTQQLSWSHFIALLPIKSDEAFMFYAGDAAVRHLSKRELRKQISRKVFERKEIANSQLAEATSVPFNMFKDPYLLDVLGLKDNYLEADLEKAILSDLESFILEFGHGFTFADRQKRMTMDGDDFTLDLLFYHRILKRLIAIELKIGKIAQTFLREALENGKADGEEVSLMLTKDYSKKIFGLDYPLLVPTDESCDSIRYYAKPLIICGSQYRLCSQWFEVPANNDRPFLLAWLDGHGVKI